MWEAHMVTIDKSGMYRLIETKHGARLLYLDNITYTWEEPPSIGEIIVTSHKVHKTDCVLSIGHYHIYNIEDEPGLSDQIHLELEIGEGHWQGYLLLSGLPDTDKKRGRIIPTQESITSSYFKRRKDSV